MSSNHLLLCHPLLLLPSIFPTIQVFSNESALSIRWPKYWSFSFRISPSNEYSGLTFFFFKDGLVWSPCSPRDSQESTPAPQFESIRSLELSFLHGPALTSIHDYWKNHSFDYMDIIISIQYSKDLVGSPTCHFDFRYLKIFFFIFYFISEDSWCFIGV